MNVGKALGTFQIVAALGIGAWWAYWFGAGKYATAEPLSDRLYENAFPPADLLFAVLLVVSGLAWHGLLARRHAAIGLTAGGMGMALAVIDTFHNLLVGAFAHASTGALVQKLVFAGVNASVGLLSVMTTWSRRAELGLREDAPLPATTRFVGLLALVATAFGAVDWVVDRGLDPNVVPLVRSLVAPSALALGFAAIGLAPDLRWPWSLACAGAVLHRFLLIATSDVERLRWLDALGMSLLVGLAADAAWRGTKRL